MTNDQELARLSHEVELQLQERWAERLRAEELFRGYSADVDDDGQDDEL